MSGSFDEDFVSETSVKAEETKEEPAKQDEVVVVEESHKVFVRPLQPKPKIEINNEKDKEIEKLQELAKQQRHIIDSQKETIKLLMNEQISYEEITKLRAALASKSPLLQLVAATPMSESRALTQLKAENAALRRQIDEIENRHMNELRSLRTQFASLSSRPIPTDGCAVCKRRIRELEAKLEGEKN